MTHRIRHLLVIAEDQVETNLSLVAAASVGAYVQQHRPTWQATVLPCRDGYSAHVLLQVVDSTVDLVAVWVDPRDRLDFRPLLDRFGMLWPDAPRVVMGSAVATEADAQYWLDRCASADLAVHGEAEHCVADLCEAVASSPGEWRRSLPKGVMGRDGSAFRHGGMRADPVSPENLTSPLQAGLVPRPHRGQRACLEVSRGALPFSPVPLDVAVGPVRPLPISRLREDLTAISEASPEILELVPSPVDVNPVHFRWVLRALTEWDQVCPVRVTLSRVPDRTLMALMRKAGVEALVFEPDTIGVRGDHSRHRPTREELLRLAAEGFQPHVVLAFGHPADDVGEMERWFDYYAGMDRVRLSLVNARLFPGHPFRASALAGRPSLGEFRRADRAGASGVPPVVLDAHHQIIAHPRVQANRLGKVQYQFGQVGSLLETFSATFRALAALTGVRLCQLAADVATDLSAGGPLEHRTTPQWRGFLLQFARKRLAAAAKMDRFPPVAALVDFEHWKAAPGSVFRVRKGVSYRVADLEFCVPKLNPGQRLANFAYDVVSIESGMSLESAPVHRVCLLRRRHESGSVTILRLEERWKAVLDFVDGRRTVGDVILGLAPPGRRARLTAIEVHETMLRLLEADIVYVKAVRMDDEIRGSSSGRNVLPFRPVLKQV